MCRAALPTSAICESRGHEEAAAGANSAGGLGSFGGSGRDGVFPVASSFASLSPGLFCAAPPRLVPVRLPPLHWRFHGRLGRKGGFGSSRRFQLAGHRDRLGRGCWGSQNGSLLRRHRARGKSSLDYEPVRAGELGGGGFHRSRQVENHARHTRMVLDPDALHEFAVELPV